MIWSSLISLGSSWLKGRQERKAKEQEARVAWESAAGRSMENGWKDEYVTVVVTFPLWQIFVGNLVFAFSGNNSILEANKASLEQIGALMGTEYGQLMMIVVLAAVGIKGLKVLK